MNLAVKNELVKNYNVIEAFNGKEGLLLALSKNPRSRGYFIGNRLCAFPLLNNLIQEQCRQFTIRNFYAKNLYYG
jgi:hypothetical protein